MTTTAQALEALPEPLPTSTEDEASILARLSTTPAEAYERGYMDGHARAIESTAAEIARLQSELSTLRAATALVQFEQRVENERLQAECEAMRKDAEIGARWKADSSLEKWFPITAENMKTLEKDAARLDYLDARNAAKNDRNGTTYGWRLTENHNRIALEDHNWPALSVRAAIDAARSTSTAPSGAEE